MKKIFLFTLIILLPSCAAFSPHHPPEITTDQVIQMSKTGTTPQEIIAKIDESRTVYYLKEEGVANEVIDFMLTTEKKEIEATERAKWRSYAYPYRYDTWYYPYYYRYRRCD
jgi:hypothetical protein